MSDLQCPARIILARHGEAAPLEGGGPRLLTDQGVAQSRRLADAAVAERVALLWSSTMQRARQTSAIVAEQLRLTVTHDDRLRELMVDEHLPLPPPPQEDSGDVHAAWLAGDLDGRMFGESGHEVVGRLRSVVEEVADRCRGETALLISHGGIIELGLTHLSRNLTASFVDAHPLNPAESVVLEVDSSGWICTHWAGRPMPH